MRLLVFVTRVFHPVVPVEIGEEGAVIQKEPAPIYVINPSDKCALEEAMHIKEHFDQVEVTVLTAGSLDAQASLYYCLARGADKAVLVQDNALDRCDIYATALLVSRIAQKLEPNVILCGSDTLDSGFSPVGPIVAELLGIPQVTRVVRVEMQRVDTSIS